MINRLLFYLSGYLPVRFIHLESGPYLERYYLGALLGVTFYLHRFVSSDSERHLHNHPWGWGRALVLSGGYDEEYVCDLSAHGCLTQTRRIRWWNRVNGNHFHRIANAEPGSWTLFAHGPRALLRLGQASKTKGWGFLEHEGGTVVFRSHPSAVSRWWLKAPLGRYSGREPCE